MTSIVAAITAVATLAGLLLKWYLSGRKARQAKEKYDEVQDIRKAVASGDVDAVNIKLDRMRDRLYQRKIQSGKD